ncbi:MAG: hypothetical protein ACKV22_09370 [Bryobacteraceae bacterium]
MELLKVQVAKAIWLFDTQDLNPRGAALFPFIFGLLGQRYQFLIPKQEDLSGFPSSRTSLFFKQGKFVFESFTVDVDMEIHSDGLVATSRHSTEACDAFLEDFKDWLASQLGVVYQPRIGKKRAYKSDLMVAGDPRIEALSSTLQGFAKTLSGLSGQAVYPSGIIFGADRTPGVFTIERRVNTSSDENEYFSISSLPTSKHLEALNELERVARALPIAPNGGEE